MAFNVSNFRNEMKFDGARANLFDVQLNFPAAFGNSRFRRDVAFKCKSAQIPGSTVNQVVVPYFGREVKFAGNRTFADWTVNIINDEDFKIRGGFERWMQLINSHGSNVRNIGRSPSSYTSDAAVTHYGKNGSVLRRYKFIGMFPTDISPIDLDWGNNDMIEEFTVTFAYQWWEAENNNSSSEVIV
jgi:hypothetical protein